VSDDAGRASDDIRALAEAVADVLEERGLVPRAAEAPGPVLKVSDVARLLGRSQAWVYEHAEELGAFRYADGPKARIGFDRGAIERWKRDRQALTPPVEGRRARRHARARKPPAASTLNLIPYDSSPRRA
jgi:predicted DNA-binding transcriptional regulator AlpA